MLYVAPGMGSLSKMSTAFADVFTRSGGPDWQLSSADVRQMLNRCSTKQMRTSAIWTMKLRNAIVGYTHSFTI